MTISFRSASSGHQAGATSVLFRQPDTVEADDIALWFATTKYPTSQPDTPTGYTALFAADGGTGTSGADDGDVRASVDYRECDGTEDAATETRTVSGGNSCITRGFGFARGGSGWLLASSYGVQSTATESWSVSAAATIDVAAGDYIVIGIHKNSDRDLNHSSHALSASGITFGTVELLHGSGAAVGTTQGDDCSMQVVAFPVSSGSGTVTLSYSVSMSGTAGATAGVVTFVRLREDAGSTPITFSGTVPTLTGYVGEAFSEDIGAYFGGTATPFAFAVTAGSLPAGLSINSSTGVISGTPTTPGSATGVVVEGTDDDAATDETNAFTIQIDSAPPSSDLGYKTVSATGYLNQRHTTVSHSFHHDGSWWTFLRDGDWDLYEESGNIPGSAGSTVDWVSSPHLAAVSSSSQLAVALDAANDKAYCIGFGASAGTIQFRELTYAAGSWTTTLSFNLAGTGGVGLGTSTTFSNHTKLSIIVDSNGVPLVFAGNKGSGASASNGCHIAWPDSPGTLDGTWTSFTVDSESLTEGDASGRAWGPVTVSGTDYVGISYTTDDTTEKLKLSYRAVQSTVANYGSGWTTITLDDTLSVDNHVWAMPMVHGGSTVILTAVKCGDGTGAGRIYLYTTDLSAGWGSQTTKRHRVSNGPGESGSLAETPSRPVGIADESAGRVHVVYHSRDSYQYGFVGYKTATLAALLAAANDGAVFDVSSARNQTPLIFDESIPSTSDAKTPAHPVTSAMGYAPVTALVTSGATTGDSIWWAALTTAVDITGTVALSGSVSVSGDLQIQIGSLDIAQAAAVALSGSVSVSGDVQIGTSFDIAQSAAIALSGSASVSGDIQPLAGTLDIAQTAAVALSGGVSVSGDIEIGTSFNLAQTAAVALSGAATVSGDVQIGVGLDLAQTNVVALAGSVSVSGDVQSSTEAVVVQQTGGGGFAWASPRKGRYKYLSPPTREQIAERVRKQREALGILPKPAQKRIEAAVKKEARRAEPSLAPLAPVAAEVAQDTGVALQSVVDAIQASWDYQRALVGARMQADAAQRAEEQRQADEQTRQQAEEAERQWQQRLVELRADDDEYLRSNEEARKQAISTIRHIQKALIALLN